MNKEAFCRDLSEIDWDFASSERLSNSLEKLLSNVNMHQNNSERSKNRNKALDYKRLWNSLAGKDKIYKHMMKESVANKKRQLEIQYKTLKQKIFNIIGSSKKIHYKNYFQENFNNIKKLWNGINEIIQNKPKLADRISLIQHKYGQNITNEKKVANEFNDFFSGVAGNLLNKRKFPGNKHYTDYL